MDLKQECVQALQQLNDDSKFTDANFKDIIAASVESILQNNNSNLKRTPQNTTEYKFAL